MSAGKSEKECPRFSGQLRWVVRTHQEFGPDVTVPVSTTVLQQAVPMFSGYEWRDVPAVDEDET